MRARSPVLRPLALALTACLLVPATGRGADETVTIDRGDPLATLAELSRRWGGRGMGADYDVARERFRLHVPDGYTGEEPYGVLVWVSPGDRGGVPDAYRAILDERRLLGIGADDSGNQRNSLVRILLAVDAARHLVRTHHVDPERIYVSGHSGGGRVASIAAVLYPDLFTGGIYVCGCNFPTAVSTGSGKYYPGFHPELAGHQLARIKRNRYAFLTASEDSNREPTRLKFEQAVNDGWTAAYIEQPDHGHAPLDAPWFAQGVEFLDAPLRERAEAGWGEVEALERSGDLHAAWRAARDAWLHGFGAGFAAEARAKAAELRPAVEELARAELAAALARADEGELRSFLERWRGLPAAAEARTALEAIGRAQLGELSRRRTSGAEIRAFRDRWAGFAVVDAADELYERRAEEAFGDLGERPPSDRVVAQLMAFEEEWTGSAAARRARERLEEVLGVALDRLEAMPDSDQRRKALKEIARSFPGTRAAARAAELLGAP